MDSNDTLRDYDKDGDVCNDTYTLCELVDHDERGTMVQKCSRVLSKLLDGYPLLANHPTKQPDPFTVVVIIDECNKVIYSENKSRGELVRYLTKCITWLANN